MKGTIVLVEDDEDLNRALGRLLRIAGFDVLSFKSPEALLASSAAESAACLLLDVQLPGVIGFDLYQRLLESGAAAPVVFITAHETDDVRQRAREAGAAGCLTKPFELQALLAAIQNAKPAP